MAHSRALRVALGNAVILFTLVAVGESAPAAPGATATPPAWTVTPVAGNGTAGFSGDGGPAVSAQLGDARGVAVDSAGAVYVADAQNHRVRKVDPTGVITTVAGTGANGFSGDGGQATSAQLFYPTDVAVDPSGHLYIVDQANNRIRKVDPSGTISTVAGSGATGHFKGGYSGDGGPATSAKLNLPGGIAFDRAGNMYIADTWNFRVRKVDTAGLITTVAGSTVRGYGGDDGPATSAALDTVADVAVDAAGNLYIADTFNSRVRKVDASGTITTFAGNGEAGFSGDGGPATSSKIYFPYGVVADAWGNVFISDYFNNRVRKVDATGAINTVVGTGVLTHPIQAGDGGHGTSVALRGPQRLDVDAAGRLLIADSSNHRVRRVVTGALFVSHSPERVTAGQDYSYTIRVGPLPTNVTGVKVVDTLPPQVAFRSVTASQGRCSTKGSTVTCALRDLPRGSTATVTIGVRAVSAGVVTNNATVSANERGAIPGSPTARAETKVSASNCGLIVIANTVLTQDIGPCAGNGIVVRADNVTLDLGGRRVFGFQQPSGPVGTAAGIGLTQRSGVTVTNGTVAHFDGGVVLTGGGTNTVSNLLIEDNVGPDDPLGGVELSDGIVLFDSASNTIKANRLLRNGTYDGIAVLGTKSDSNVIEDNTVEDTLGTADGGAAGQGIIVNASSLGDMSGEVITNTRIAGNAVRRSGSSGISNVNSADGVIVANTIEGNGRTNGPGNGIGIQLGPQALVVATNLLVERNEVHGNYGTGIEIPPPPDILRSRSATGNRILFNNAADNALNRTEYFLYWDLNDANPECAGNTWIGNTWGSGGYDPVCTSTGGTGPALSATASPSDPAIAEPVLPVLRAMR